MTEKKLSYWEQLRDPRWQQKRLKIMERDNWTCVCCGSKSDTLNVHHMYYERGLTPWDYPDESLQTVCEDCHEFIQGRLTELQRAIGLAGWEYIEHAIGFLRGSHSREGPGIKVTVDSEEVAYGLATAWGVKPRDVVALAMKNDGFVMSDELSELYRAQNEQRDKERRDGRRLDQVDDRSRQQAGGRPDGGSPGALP